MYKIIKNKDLGYFEVENKPSEEELKDFYEKTYYQENKGSYSHEYSKSELNYKLNKIQLKSNLANYFLPDNHKKKILDVGCGEGFVLKEFNKMGWDVKGLDYSKYGCKTHNKEIADKVTEGNIYNNLKELVSRKEKFDLIWLDNVLEHVTDVGALLNMCRELSREHTVLSLTVPNDFSKLQMSLLSEEKIKKEFWVRTPDHLNYFTAETLRKTLDNYEWNTCSIISDFPIDWYLTHKHANYIENNKVGKAAHQSRVWLFNHIAENNNIKDVITFYESLANIGMGRNITGFFQLMNMPKVHHD